MSEASAETGAERPESEAENPTEGIARLDQYVNARGQHITAAVPANPADPHHFQGADVFHGSTPEGQHIAKPVSFPIEAETIQEAFQNWAAARKAKLREMNKPKIAIARLAPTGGNGEGRRRGR